MFYLKNSISRIYNNPAFKIVFTFISIGLIYALAVNYSVSALTADPSKNFLICSLYAAVLVVISAPIISFTLKNNLLKFKKLNNENESALKNLRLYFEAAPTGIVAMDTNYIIKEWNPEAERIFGFARNEVAGKISFKKIIPHDVKTHLERFIDVIRGGNQASLVCDMFDIKSGKWATCQWSFVSLYNENKKYIGIICAVNDITKEMKHDTASASPAGLDEAATEAIELPANIYNLDGSKAANAEMLLISSGA